MVQIQSNVPFALPQPLVSGWAETLSLRLSVLRERACVAGTVRLAPTRDAIKSDSAHD